MTNWKIDHCRGNCHRSMFVDIERPGAEKLPSRQQCEAGPDQPATVDGKNGDSSCYRIDPACQSSPGWTRKPVLPLDIGVELFLDCNVVGEVPVYVDSLAVDLSLVAHTSGGLDSSTRRLVASINGTPLVSRSSP